MENEAPGEERLRRDAETCAREHLDVKPMAAGCRLYSGMALPSGIHCKRSRASDGIPRVNAMPLIMRLIRLGIMDESKSA